MHRETMLFAGLLFLLTPFLLAQEPQSQAISRLPEDAPTGRQLVAWSQLQKPKPVPQPLPPSDSHPDPQLGQPPDPHGGRQSPNQTFTGKIVRDGEKYVLKDPSNTTYQLDDQTGTEKYQNQDVTLVGTLDTGSTTIHIVRIEPLS